MTTILDWDSNRAIPFTLWLLPGKWFHFAVGMGLFQLVINWFR